MPIEIRRVGGNERWFRMAESISLAEIALSTSVSEALDGPLQVAFHLPGDAEAIHGLAEAQEVVISDGEAEWAERRTLVFLVLNDAARLKIGQYIEESLA